MATFAELKREAKRLGGSSKGITMILSYEDTIQACKRLFPETKESGMDEIDLLCYAEEQCLNTANFWEAGGIDHEEPMSFHEKEKIDLIESLEVYLQ